MNFLCYLSSYRQSDLPAFLSLLSQDVAFSWDFYLLLHHLSYPPVTPEYVRSSPLLWWLSDRIIYQDLFCRRLVYLTIWWLYTRFSLTMFYHQSYLHKWLLCRYFYSLSNIVDGWKWCWRPWELSLCCVQLAIPLTTHSGSHQWLSLIVIEGTLFTLPSLKSRKGVDSKVVFLVGFRLPCLRLMLGS